MQTLCNLSEREVIEQVDTNILFRAFVGFSLTDEVPHWTLPGQFRKRLGAERFETIFNQIVRLAKEGGLLDPKLIILDSTDVRADVDLSRCKKGKQDDDDTDYLDRNTSDPDARTGHKSTKSRWYGYKSHVLMDAKSEIITSCTTTSANDSDVGELVTLVDQERELLGKRSFRRLTGDKGYVGRTDKLRKRKIKDYVIPRKNMKQKRHNTHYLHSSRQRYKIERKFAEAKKQHGLQHARYRGRWKVHIQCLMTYITMNLKRIVNLQCPRQRPTW